MPLVALRLAALAEAALGIPLPVSIRAWDGSRTGPPDAPELIVRQRALRRVLWRPGELGLARAWVAGDIDLDGDLYAALDAVYSAAGEPGDAVATGRRHAHTRFRTALFDPVARHLIREALALAGPGLPPRPPVEEAPPRRGPRHALHRDRSVVSHHYDVGNEFYELMLGPSMVYSCAYWDTDVTTLEQAQAAKLELVCRKLALRPDQRLLDVGCGWGSMALHAARQHGVQVVGVTLSVEQARYARGRVAEAGLGDRVEIRVQDYREVDDRPFDAISSIGMAEHVGARQYRAYADVLYRLLRPGGRLLNHQIARRPLPDEKKYRIDEFIDHYVFPDGELQPVGSTVTVLEQAGFEVRDAEALRENYARTLRCWVANLERQWDRAVGLAGAGRARVWRLYMTGSALGFDRNRIGVNQILAVRPHPTGSSDMPATRSWLCDPNS